MRSIPLRPVICFCALLGVLSIFAVRPGSADTTVGGTISTDTTWTLSGSPYILTSSIYIRGTDGADGITTLQIEPGVQIRVNNGCMIMVGGSSGNPGALAAQGTSGSPVTFTSNAASPAAGDWYGLWFYSTTHDAGTVMEHCIVEYAGLIYGSIYAYQSAPTFRHVTVQHGKNHGAHINASEPVFENCTFVDNQDYDLYYTGTVGGSVTGCTVNNGIYLLTYGEVQFSGNTVNQNNAFPIKTFADNAGGISSSTFNNVDADSYLAISGSGQVTRDATWSAGIPYAVKVGIYVKGTDGADGITTLNIQPGAQLKFSKNQQMCIGAASGNPGALVAQGTVAEPIVFTSNEAAPAAGDWYGLRFLNTCDNAATVLEHCIVEYGGLSEGAIYPYQASPTLRHVTVRYSKTYGAYIYNSEPLFENCTFVDNQNYDLYYVGTVGGSVTGCTVNNGIYLVAAGLVQFSGNTVNQNNAFPIKAHADNVGGISSSSFNNIDADSYLEVRSAYITRDATWTAHIPYHLVGAYVQGTDGADGVTTLTIEPGAILKFNATQMLAIGTGSGNPGALVAQGTAEKKILFTSNKTAPAAGDWYGIRFYNTADDTISALSHCIVDYAGYNYSEPITGAVYIYDAQVPVSHCILRNSSKAGVYLYASNSEITDSSFLNNQYGIYCENNSQPVIRQNDFNTHTTAIYVINSSPVIDNSTMEMSSNSDLIISGTANGSVTGCTFNSGLNIAGVIGTIEFSENTINQNNALPIKTNAEHAGKISNSTFNNVDADSYMEVSASSWITKDATWTARIPYHLITGANVQGTDGADSVTTLTIEPGAILKFGQGLGLNVGAATGNPGALIAQGTSENKILFTSNKATQTAGDWYGVRFLNTADDSISALSNCIVEFAGYNNSGAVYLYDAKPPVSYCILRNSSFAGVYVYGSDPEITCNTFVGNKHGIHCQNNAQPLIHQNNFNANALYGVRNTSTPIINAEDNWWGDAAGPNTGGDAIYGNVDADPWSTAQNDCISGSDNQPPNSPSAPVPADNAVRVTLTSGYVTLQWAGGDPNPQDAVTYDVLWGETESSLAVVAQDLAQNQYTKTDLSLGSTYFWQVTARDDAGLESTGPVWRFTTNGEPPDLGISQLTTDPAGHMQAGQSVTLTAHIQNSGSGPAVDQFAVDFRVDDVSIGTVAVDQVLLAGQTVQVSQTWTYNGGNPTITVVADNLDQVTETQEANNSFSASLSAIADNTAPALVGTSPADDAALNQIQQITATLADTQSEIDHAAVAASFSVIDSGQQSIGGTVGTSDDTFIFVPGSLPLPDSTYQVSLIAADTYGNTQPYQFVFTIDNQPPEKPVITGGIVDSGTIQARPVQNASSAFVVDLTGTREAGTSVWVNGVEKVAVGDADWLTPITLSPGANAVEVWLKDRAGNQGLSEWVDIQMQTGAQVDYTYDAAGRVKRIESNQ